MADHKTPAEEAAELRAATREAHEAMKDMRALMREMRDLREEVRTVAATVFGEQMAAQVKAGLDEYGTTIHQSIEDATAAVHHRFEVIARILSGDGRKDGERLVDYAQRLIAIEEEAGRL